MKLIIYICLHSQRSMTTSEQPAPWNRLDPGKKTTCRTTSTYGNKEDLVLLIKDSCAPGIRMHKKRK